MTLGAGAFSEAPLSADRVSAGGGGYTLTAATGAFTTTGNAAALRAGRKLAAAQASYTTTGYAAALRAGRKIAAASATFAATFYDATLTYSGSGGAYTLTAEAATFATTGNAATLRAARKLVAASASFATTGYAATLIDGGRRLSAGAASFATTFYPATLTTTGTVEAPAPDVTPAGKSKRKKRDGLRRVIVGDTLYEVPERDLPALLEARLLNRKPPRTAQTVAKPAAAGVQTAQAPDAALVVPDYYPSVIEAQERYTALMREFQAQADADVRAMLDRVASRVLAELEDEEDAAAVLLMQ